MRAIALTPRRAATRQYRVDDRPGRALVDPASPDEVALDVDGVVLDVRPAVEGIDHLTVADVEPDVVRRVTVEDEVTRLELRDRHVRGVVVLLLGGVRQ